mmetsp:Transcript_2689/g.7477  ORF Transcript_2689/g.7477 Transcript_2689/m.7477 type:complete len:312 (-) Transcript_2689:113-1048(-)
MSVAPVRMPKPTRDPLLLLAGLVSFFVWNGIQVGSLAIPSPTSSLARTRWKLLLDVGIQPGTWMPKRFPGWGESGVRLPLQVTVEFTSQSSPAGETLVGPKADTFVLKVCDKDSTTTFMSEFGEQTVTFADGGWCIQRPTADILNAEGSAVKPEGLLRFWLDCSSGAKKRDVEIVPRKRIFFTTGVWDDPQGVESMEREYQLVLEQLQTIMNETRQIRNDAANNEKTDGLLNKLSEFRTLVGNSKDFDRLVSQKEALERASPPPSVSQATNGVKIAPTGSLVVKGNSIPDWLPGSEYLILGTFSTKAIEDD